MTDSDFLTSTIFEFKRLKSLAEKGLAQTIDEDFFKTIDDDQNSIAVVVKHIGGNLKSRFDNFLTSDGEKRDRNRDGEFETHEADSRESLMQLWQSGWQTLLDSIGQLKADDLNRLVLIRVEEHTVMQALTRSLTHTACHVGQILMLCKQFAGEDWKTLSVPKGKSIDATKSGKGYFDHYGK